jgi:UDP-N-acetylmuramyl-tripeptide synthetase
MLLEELIENTGYVVTNTGLGIDITGITYDSRQVKSGYIFVCLHGQHTDGKLFINDAVNRGAKCIIYDMPIPVPAGTAFILTSNLNDTLAELSNKLYDYPSTKLNLIGITGTNGKTTTSYLLEEIYTKNMNNTAVIGTINYRINKEVVSVSKNTTPFSSDLQFLFDKSLASKVDTVIMEVSSHGLALNRLSGCEFDVAVFTNLTHDHLAFHKTTEDYFTAKQKLFKMLAMPGIKQRTKIAVINNDDPYGRQIAGMLTNTGIVVATYGITEKGAKYKAVEIKPNTVKTRFTIKNNGTTTEISTNLIGKYNIYNILAAFTCAVSQGINPETVKQAVESVSYIPGRLEKVEAGQSFTVLVDYAHTDDALSNVLAALNEIKTITNNSRRIITVFGCGGDRDRSKRPVMGEIAVTASDYVIVTSDNPRSEDPNKIILDIEVGIRRICKDNYEIVTDRDQAIKKAVGMANKNDIILIAGKGHEDYQIIGDKKTHFSDVETAIRHIKQLNGRN